MGQQGAAWTRIAKDRERCGGGGGGGGDPGGRLLPAVEGHSFEQNRIKARPTPLLPSTHSSIHAASPS